MNWTHIFQSHELVQMLHFLLLCVGSYNVIGQARVKASSTPCFRKRRRHSSRCEHWHYLGSMTDVIVKGENRQMWCSSHKRCASLLVCGKIRIQPAMVFQDVHRRCSAASGYHQVQSTCVICSANQTKLGSCFEVQEKFHKHLYIFYLNLIDYKSNRN